MSAQKRYLGCSLAVLEAPALGQTLVVALVRSMIPSPHLVVVSYTTPAVFTTTFGPGGFTTTRMGGQYHRQGNENTEPRSMLLQLLPLLILFGFSLLSALPSLFGSTPVPDPRFSFQRTSRYNVERQTDNLGVKYHVNSAEFMAHPVIGAELARDGVDVGKVERADEKAAKAKVKKQKRGPALHKFEHTIERVYTQDRYADCQRGVDRKERLKEQEIGLFGIGTDWEKVKKIEQEVVESCEELKRLGVLAR
jgi:DnaJ family protein B protein 12